MDGNTVQEYLCGPDGLTYEEIDCPSENPVCDNGRCDCPDTDGGRNYYRRGTILGNTDSCFFDTDEVHKLREWYCGKSTAGNLVALDEAVVCPSCGSDNARKLMSSFAVTGSARKGGDSACGSCRPSAGKCSGCGTR